MNRLQQGFTLIELMIVVAIIGILAAVAIPAYGDYTARAQVAEAMSLTSALKVPLTEYISDNGTYPADVATIGGTDTGKYVNTITLTGAVGGGNVTVTVDATMKSTGVNSKIAGSVFAMATTDSGKTWTCGGLVGDTDIADSLLPGACK
jgi:type IV pilus assembly protein PilA